MLTARSKHCQNAGLAVNRPQLSAPKLRWPSLTETFVRPDVCAVRPGWIPNLSPRRLSISGGLNFAGSRPCQGFRALLEFANC